MATTFRNRGRTSAVPRAETNIDTSALAGSPAGPVGIVAVLGDGVGGLPISPGMTPDDFLTASNESQLRALIKSGPLLNAGLLLLNPADQDPVIQGGAQQLYLMKTNQAEQAFGYLTASGSNVVKLTAAGYGSSGNAVNTTVAINGDGSRSLTVVEGVTTEAIAAGGTVDDARFSALYTPGSGETKAWDVVSMGVHTDAVRAIGTKTNTTLVADLNTGGAACGSGIIRVTSTLTGGTLTLTVYGRTSANVPTKTVFSLGNGAAVQTDSLAASTDFILAAVRSRALLSGESIAIADKVTSADGLDMVSGATSLLALGCVIPTNMGVAGVPVGYAFSSTGTNKAILWGKDSFGLSASEYIASAPTPVANKYTNTATLWSSIEVIVLTEMVNNLELAGFASISSEASTRDLVATVGGNPRFTAAQVDMSAFDPTQLDIAVDSGTSLASSVLFYSKLQDVIDAVNLQSGLETAARLDFTPQSYTATVTVTTSPETWRLTVGGQSVEYVSTASETATDVASILAARWNVSPVTSMLFAASSALGVVILVGRTAAPFTISTTGSTGGLVLVVSVAMVDPPSAPDAQGPVFLTTGTEGTTLLSDYVTALTLLEGIAVNAVLPLSMDPDVLAAVKAHCIKMQDRRAYVGISELDDGVPTGELVAFSSLRTQIRAINCEFVSAFYQKANLTDEFGRQVKMGQPFVAAVNCGMDMAAPVGEATTNKRAKITKLYQDVSCDPVVAADDLIQAGAAFARDLRTKGFRWVRDVTTFLNEPDNIAKTAASVNRVQTLLYSRTQTFAAEVPGRRGSPTFLGQLKAGYLKMLDQAVADGVLVSYDPTTLILTLTGDQLVAKFKAVPPVAINFALTEIVFELPVFTT